MPITGLQLITVTGKYLYLDGSPAVGTITFLQSSVLVNGAANEVVVPKIVTATLDATGAFSIQLPATNDPDFIPTNFTYSVVEHIAGRLDRKYHIAIPYDAVGATVDMADISGVPGVSGYDTRVLYVSGAPQTISKLVTFGVNPAFNDAAIPQSKVAGLVARFAALEAFDFTGVAYLDVAQTFTATQAFTGASGVNTNFVMDNAQTGPFLRFTGSALSAEARAAANVALIVKGAASQSADLQQWQNSAGTVLARINSQGFVYTQYLADLAETGSYLGTNPSSVGNGMIFITTRSAANVGLVVRGVASQAGNLQEWQNNSGTVLARINSNGGAVIGAGATADQPGGTVVIHNAGAAISGTPSGGGVLYVEEGTLKYKGSSGTVTTIAPA